MARMDSYWERQLLPFALRLYNNKYLLAIRYAFFTTMPFLLTVALLDVADSLLLDPAGPLLGEKGLNLGFWLTGGLTGDAYRQNWLVQALTSCRNAISLGYGLVSVVLAMALSGRLADIWKADRQIAVLCSLSAFLLLMPLSAGEHSGLSDYFSERRFFSAFLVAFTATRLFACLSRQARLHLGIPRHFPPEMSKYLAALPAILFTLLAFLALSVALSFAGTLGAGLLERAEMLPLYQTLGFALFYQSVVWLLWWFGIPGYSFTSFMQRLAYVPAQAGNQLGDTELIFTSGFFEAGMMHVLGLAIAILVFSRHDAWRSAARFGLPLAAFNLQEPIVFGLPVALNPFFLVPYILAPLANTFVGWLAMHWDIVPVFKFSVSWTMPIVFHGTMGTNSFMGGVLQVVWLVTDIFIYAPFVIMANMAELGNEAKDGDTR